MTTAAPAGARRSRQLLSLVFDRVLSLAQDALRLRQLGAVEASLDGVVVVIDDLQGLVLAGLGSHDLLDQFLASRRVPGDLVAVDADCRAALDRAWVMACWRFISSRSSDGASGMLALRSRASPP